jgi:hypothetical protein
LRKQWSVSSRVTDAVSILAAQDPFGQRRVNGVAGAFGAQVADYWKSDKRDVAEHVKQFVPHKFIRKAQLLIEDSFGA